MNSCSWRHFQRSPRGAADRNRVTYIAMYNYMYSNYADWGGGWWEDDAKSKGTVLGRQITFRFAR